MEKPRIIDDTAEAAFVTSEERTIMGWNQAAQQLLGHEEPQVLGKPCYEVLGGRDVFGNRFCDVNCPVANMTRRHEAVHRFELDVTRADSESVRADLSIIVVRGPTRSKFNLIHLVRPLGENKEAENAGSDPGTAGSSEQDSNFEPTSVSLTRREIEILQLVAAGTGTTDIARILNVSVSTIRNHLQSILTKLNVHSRLEAVFRARQHGLL